MLPPLGETEQLKLERARTAKAASAHLLLDAFSALDFALMGDD